MDGLKSEILEKKEKLILMEKRLDEEISNLASKEELYQKQCSEMDYFKSKHGEELVNINCSGKLFTTKLGTLLGIRDTFFYRLFQGGFDHKQIIELDRNPRFFLQILDFLRFRKLDINSLKKEDKMDLRFEAQYFEITDLLNQLGEFNAKLEITSFEYSGDYSYKGKIAGTGRLEDLSDKSLQKGICATSPGFILFTLNDEFKIKELKIGGFCGNASLWNSANGEGATILTSVDKTNWITVGAIPNGFGTDIKTVMLTPSVGKYIKFQSTTYLGIGYLEIKSENT